MKLYVGGLAYATTSDELQDLFASFGEITSAEVIMDRDTGRSKGFGFVSMANDAEALVAIEELNGKDFAGRTITVNEARPMEKREPRSGGGGYGGGGGGGRRNDRRQDSGRRY
ncbi:MAG: RNA-binding protein [Candidatus Saccharimonadales bacterium]